MNFVYLKRLLGYSQWLKQGKTQNLVSDLQTQKKHI